MGLGLDRGPAKRNMILSHSGSAQQVSQRLDDQAERGQICLMHRAWPAKSQAGMVQLMKPQVAVYHQGHSCPSADMGVQGCEVSRGAEDAAGEAPLLDLLAVEQHDRLRKSSAFHCRKGYSVLQGPTGFRSNGRTVLIPATLLRQLHVTPFSRAADGGETHTAWQNSQGGKEET